ncbi:MAG: glycosyltransferase [Hyphomicrobiaceae bacterium]
MLASRQDITSSAESQYAPVLIDKAVNGLWRDTADLSARTPQKLWQPLLAAALSGLAIGSVLVAPELAAGALAAVLAVPFLCVVLLRAAAVIEILWRTFAPHRVAPRFGNDEARLPVYSILIPLHREAEVLADLVHGLAMLDYPAAKLQILLVLESDDADTRRAAAALDLPGNFEIVVVPDRGPRTKPKALNYALGFVRGEFVAVYDAEDIPEPDQLRRALAIFRRSGPNLACIQARLNIYNPDASWLTRQFTLEYSALFDAILPALHRLGLPVPLGGTSNHFRTELLRRIGAWDPYNVTEDADLGIRIARAGLTTATLDSTTWEEAPVRLGNWLTQRTRWIKGWMQTYLVHTRRPIRLLRELGLRQWAGLHVLMGGILLSVLMHPLSYLLLAFEGANGRLFEEPGGHLQHWLWWVAVFNLGAGYASAMIVAVLAAVRRGRSDLAPHASCPCTGCGYLLPAIVLWSSSCELPTCGRRRSTARSCGGGNRRSPGEAGMVLPSSWALLRAICHPNRACWTRQSKARLARSMAWASARLQPSVPGEADVTSRQYSHQHMHCRRRGNGRVAANGRGASVRLSEDRRTYGLCPGGQGQQPGPIHVLDHLDAQRRHEHLRSADDARREHEPDPRVGAGGERKRRRPDLHVQAPARRDVPQRQANDDRRRGRLVRSVQEGRHR